jgi:hypothetical protein
MALISFGPVIADARNKFAGVVFAKGHYGNYVKKKTSPGSLSTPASASAKGVFLASAKTWANTLSATQRTLWQTLASNNPVTDTFNNVQHLTGIAYFIRVNAALKTLAAAHVITSPYTVPPQLRDAPTDQSYHDIRGLTAAYTPGPPATLTVTPASTPTGNDQLVVCARAPCSPGRTTAATKSILVLQVFAPGTTPPYDITEMYQTKHGIFPSYGTIILAAYCIRNTNGAYCPKYIALAGINPFL